MRLFQIVSYIFWLLICNTLVLILLGISIRITHSGLSCPDWPFCYQLWIPSYSKFIQLPDISFEHYQLLLEWGHRGIAGILISWLMLLLLIFITKICIKYPFAHTYPLVICYMLSCCLLCVQVFLGSATVFLHNSYISVALHVVTASMYYITIVSSNLFTNLYIQQLLHLNLKSDYTLDVAICKRMTRRTITLLVLLQVSAISGVYMSNNTFISLNEISNYNFWICVSHYLFVLLYIILYVFWLRELIAHSIISYTVMMIYVLLPILSIISGLCIFNYSTPTLSVIHMFVYLLLFNLHLFILYRSQIYQ